MDSLTDNSVFYSPVFLNSEFSPKGLPSPGYAFWEPKFFRNQNDYPKLSSILLRRVPTYIYTSMHRSEGPDRLVGPAGRSQGSLAHLGKPQF